jgi:hypothetical protein
VHSAQFTNSASFTGKRGLVVGTANTAHDITEDMLHHSLSSVTMLQRRRTYVFPAEHLKNLFRVSYCEEVPTEEADRQGESMPLSVIRLLAMWGLGAQAKGIPEVYEGLEAKGFRVLSQGDVYWHVLERIGGKPFDNCHVLLVKKHNVFEDETCRKRPLAKPVCVN